MSIDVIKLFRPQAGDIVIVDFNKVNVTQVENVLVDSKIPVIAVHDINTIKLYGLREQADHSQQVAELQLKLETANKEILRLNRIVKDEMIPKPSPVAATTTTPLPKKTL
jgi:hypothetical protein